MLVLLLLLALVARGQLVSNAEFEANEAREQDEARRANEESILRLYEASVRAAREQLVQAEAQYYAVENSLTPWVKRYIPEGSTPDSVRYFRRTGATMSEEDADKLPELKASLQWLAKMHEAKWYLSSAAGRSGTALRDSSVRWSVDQMRRKAGDKLNCPSWAEWSKGYVRCLMLTRLREIKAAWEPLIDSQHPFETKPTQENYDIIVASAKGVYLAAFGPLVITPAQRDLADKMGQEWAETFKENLFAENPGMRRGHSINSAEARVRINEAAVYAKEQELRGLQQKLTEQGLLYSARWIKTPSFKRAHEAKVAQLKEQINATRSDLEELKRK